MHFKSFYNLNESLLKQKFSLLCVETGIIKCDVLILIQHTDPASVPRVPQEAGWMRPGRVLWWETCHLSWGRVCCERAPMWRRSRLLLQRPVSPEVQPVHQALRNMYVFSSNSGHQHIDVLQSGNVRDCDLPYCSQRPLRPLLTATTTTEKETTMVSANASPTNSSSPARQR